MGKVKDGAPAAKAAKPSKGAPARGSKRRFAQFLTNLAKRNLYKPMQGRYARLYTAIGLGLIVGARALAARTRLARRLRIRDPLRDPGRRRACVLGWIIFRLVEYPPFVEFLIATEAEMNKVSWTSREDLYRATTVVLVTVALVAVFLFGVDWVWSTCSSYSAS